MRCTSVGDTGSGNQLKVLPADNTKMYIIHGILLYVSNTAGTAASYNSIGWTDFWTSTNQNMAVYITPSVVGAENLAVMGLNLPIMPGTEVFIVSDAAPASRSVRLFYTEVNV